MLTFTKMLWVFFVSTSLGMLASCPPTTVFLRGEGSRLLAASRGTASQSHHLQGKGLFSEDGLWLVTSPLQTNPVSRVVGIMPDRDWSHLDPSAYLQIQGYGIREGGDSSIQPEVGSGVEKERGRRKQCFFRAEEGTGAAYTKWLMGTTRT